MSLRATISARLLPLSRKVQLALVMVALAVIGTLSVISYHAIDRDLTESALSRRQSVSYLAAITLSERFDRLTDIAVSLATRVRFRQLVSSGKWNEAIEILHDVPRNFPFIERVFLSDVSGTLMADAPALPGVRGKNFSERDWFRGVNRQSEPYVSNVYQRAAVPQLNVIAIAVPVQSEHSPAGILVLQVKLDTFFEWIKSIDIGQDGFVYVVDRQGTVAFHPKVSAQSQLHNFSGVSAVRNVLRGETGVETFADPSDRSPQLMVYRPIAKYGWGVVVEQPVAVAFAAKERLLASGLAAFALVLALLAATVYLIARILAQSRQSKIDRQTNLDLEQRVRQRTAQIEATNKELESFSYSVSHDLRAPIRAIDGFSMILQEDYAARLDDEGKRLLSVIRRNSQTMGQLIDDLLTFSRFGRREVSASEVDMDQLLNEVLAELRQQHNGAWPIFTCEKLPSARADRALLRQVWVNLLSNAIKFSVAAAPARIDIGAKTENGESVYYVRDNGAGFDMRYYNKLFGVFQRLHSAEEFPGTGVGLAIVQRVILRHGGRIWAESSVNAGATFYFSLPSGEHHG